LVGRYRLIAIVALALLTACQSVAPPAVHTNRADALSLSAPDGEESFHFVIFGDRTAGPPEGIETLRRAVTETNLLGPDLVMTVGDLVPGYNGTPQWLDEMREYKSVMAGLAMPWYPVAGNHDVYWGGSDPPPGQHDADYEASFGPLWYWFGHKDAAFIVLYSDEGDPETNRKGFDEPALIQMSQAQLSWLERTLQETAGYDHVFVFLHHPRWITDRYRGGNWESVHKLLAAAGNVSAVFAGHIHRQRFDGLHDGIAYFTLATIGGDMPMDVAGTGWLNHSLQVTVRPTSFAIATIPVGSVLDPKSMTPEHLKDLDLARQISIERLSDPLVLGADGAASGALRYRLRNDAAHPVDVTVSLGHQAGDWLARPDRHQMQIAPKEEQEIELSVQRDADGFRSAFSVPTVGFQVDYLGEDRPVSFPENYLFVPLKAALGQPSEGSPPADRALHLNGGGSGLWFSPDLIDLRSAPFTLEAYIRTDEPHATGVVIGKFYDDGYALMLMDGRPQFVLGLKGNRINLRALEQSVVEPGSWHHIAAVFDGAQARLYLDGTLVGWADAPTGQTFKPNDLPLFVGGNATWDGSIEFSFPGAIDELRISTEARYEGNSFEPARRFDPDDETALLLHLDGDGAPFARDASPHGRHGIAMGEIQYVTP
jgi:Concanavalin A-like lectin/glucanases superfamily/Calcineurin-like phosphoesterase